MHGGDNVLYHSYMTLYIIVTDITINQDLTVMVLEGLRRSGPMDLHFINHSNSSQFITYRHNKARDQRNIKNQ